MPGLSLVAASGGYSLEVVCGLLIAVASLGPRAGAGGFSSRGTQAELPCGMRHLPGPGIEHTSPALAGGFLTTGPPRKSSPVFLIYGKTPYP